VFYFALHEKIILVFVDASIAGVENDTDLSLLAKEICFTS
jgi:hypothetical protein